MNNCVCLLVGDEPKETTKVKMRRRKDLFLAAVKRTPGIFLKAVDP